MPTIITTPRPPLNLFEVVRIPVGETFTTIYEVPKYRIPASGPDPQRDVEAAAVLTGMMVANTSAVPITIDVQIIDAGGTAHALATDLTVPVGDYLSLTVDRQVLKTDEVLQMRCGTAQTAVAHLSFILNQREEFTVIA